MSKKKATKTKAKAKTTVTKLEIKKDDVIQGSLCDGDGMCATGFYLNKVFRVPKSVLNGYVSPEAIADKLSPKKREKLAEVGILKSWDMYRDGSDVQWIDGPTFDSIAEANDSDNGPRWSRLKQIFKKKLGVTLSFA